ncbi:MAG: substrate-binding domain-containing protein [Planctomycetaceae bacterium]|nr:substrate-binding domain-containing protein [Planctomycetaceae bacterium]
MRILQGSHAIWGLLLTVAFSAGCQSEIPREGGGSSPGASADAGSKRRIIVLVNNASSFWDPCRSGVQDAERDLNLASAGLTATMEVPDGTIQGQLDRLRQFGSQSDIAAIGISPLESDNAAIADELQKLKAKGIPIVTFDSDLDRTQFRELRAAFLGTNNRSAGEALGTCAKALRPDGGSYVSFVGRTGAQNAIERIDGFAAGAGEMFQSKDTMADDGDRSRARENVRNALQNHTDLNLLVGIWSYNAPAIVDVVRDQNLREKLAVAVFDAEPGTIAAMDVGDVDVMIVQDPYAMGFQTTKLLAAMVQKDDATIREMLPEQGQPDGDIFDTGIKVVVPTDKSPITPDLFPGKVQHMTLATFKEWLSKYGLSGS